MVAKKVRARNGGTNEALVLAVAHVSVNEGALQRLRETALIWQVTEGHGATNEKRLEFLRKHSPRALGLKPCGGIGNCDWSHQLTRAGTLPAALAVTGTRADWWAIARQGRWEAVLAATEAMVRGADYVRPCKTTPETWGSPRIDGAYAKAHGLCRLHCGEAGELLNDGYAPC